jgi:Raf kinase inhibitor-like YbhB/YbcL family protein
MTFTLSSSAVGEGLPIPAKHTCDGADTSPPLAWSGAPAGTQSFAIIMDDPDAPMGTWVHWVLWNLPGTVSSLAEHVPKTERLPQLGGALQGNNTWPQIGYNGPCPPPGKPHRYFFKLYALDAVLGLKSGAGKTDLERAMQNHVLGQAQLMGTYGRKR